MDKTLPECLTTCNSNGRGMGTAHPRGSFGCFTPNLVQLRSECTMSAWERGLGQGFGGFAKMLSVDASDVDNFS